MTPIEIKLDENKFSWAKSSVYLVRTVDAFRNSVKNIQISWVSENGPKDSPQDSTGRLDLPMRRIAVPQHAAFANIDLWFYKFHESEN